MPRFASGIEFDYAFRSPALPGFTSLYVHKGSDSGRAAALADLLSWMFSPEAQSLAMTEGYPQLPDALLTKIKVRAESLP